MPSPSERDPWLYVADMIAHCERALRHVAGCELDQLAFDELRWDALIRALELIGEAATRVPLDVRAKAPELPWRQVVATRNRLIHGYNDLSPKLVAAIVADDLPSLRDALRVLLDQRPPP